MRFPTDVVWHISLSAEESDFAEAMQSQVGLPTKSDLIRLSLWHLARHLDVPVGNQIFAVRGKRERRKVSA